MRDVIIKLLFYQYKIVYFATFGKEACLTKYDCNKLFRTEKFQGGHSSDAFYPKIIASDVIHDKTVFVTFDDDHYWLYSIGFNQTIVFYEFTMPAKNIVVELNFGISG